MHAVSTNQIADILHFNDNILYIIHLKETTKWYGTSFSKKIYVFTPTNWLSVLRYAHIMLFVYIQYYLCAHSAISVLTARFSACNATYVLIFWTSKPKYFKIFLIQNNLVKSKKIFSEIVSLKRKEGGCVLYCAYFAYEVLRVLSSEFVLFAWNIFI